MAVNMNFQLSGSLIGTLNGATSVYRWASPNGLMPSGTMRLFDGTGATQAHVAVVKPFSILTTANLDLDMTSGLTDINNQAVNLTKLKYFCFVVTAPVSGDYLKVGPQAVTNAFQGPWGGVAASNYEEVRDVPYENGGLNWAGWTVDGTHRVIRLNNPTLHTLTGWYILVGL